MLISTPTLASLQPKLDLQNLKYLRSEGLPLIPLRQQQDKEGGQGSTILTLDNRGSSGVGEVE